MVIGLGTDLVEVDRIAHSIERYGERFLSRIYTAAERDYCAPKRFPAQNLAARFAAKEAGAKALGTGISRGVGWKDIEVLRDPGRPPRLVLHGRARALADSLGVRHTSVSLTHTDTQAMATVIFES